jgi:hypothetical protein
MRLGLKIGKGCAAMMHAKMRDLPCHYLNLMGSARKKSTAAWMIRRNREMFGRSAL